MLQLPEAVILPLPFPELLFLELRHVTPLPLPELQQQHALSEDHASHAQAGATAAAGQGTHQHAQSEAQGADKDGADQHVNQPGELVQGADEEGADQHVQTPDELVQGADEESADQHVQWPNSGAAWRHYDCTVSAQTGETTAALRRKRKRASEWGRARLKMAMDARDERRRAAK